MRHQPKGSMCCSCVQRGPCAHLDFSSMMPLDTYEDGTIVVKCTEFKREDRD